LVQRRLALHHADQPAVRDLTRTRQELAALLLSGDTVSGTAQRVQQLSARKEELEKEVARQLPDFAAALRAARRSPEELSRTLPAESAFIDLVRHARFTFDPERPGRADAARSACYVAFVLCPGQPARRVELGAA